MEGNEQSRRGAFGAWAYGPPCSKSPSTPAGVWAYLRFGGKSPPIPAGGWTYLCYGSKSPPQSPNFVGSMRDLKTNVRQLTLKLGHMSCRAAKVRHFQQGLGALAGKPILP